MKPGTSILFVVIASCLFLTACHRPSPSPAKHEDAPLRKVTVVGTSTIKVVPDQMNWTVNVSINDSTLAKAKARHDASLGTTLEFIKSLGDAIKNPQTGGIRFDKNLYPGEDTEARKNPFSCSTQVVFTLTDFDQYGPICDEMVKIDGVQIQSIDYVSSKEETTRKQALTQALAKAREKAMDLALTAGCSIDKPLLILEGTIDNSQPAMAVLEDRGPTPSGTPNAVVDKIEVTGTVTVTYDLMPK